MKKTINKIISLTLSFALVGMWGCASEEDEWQRSADEDALAGTRSLEVSCVIKNLTAGQLETRLQEEMGADNVSKIDHLTITGEFSYTDAYYIRSNIKEIKSLDLSGVTQLKASTNSDNSNWEDTDTLEGNMFESLSSLQEMELPEGIIKEIKRAAFAGCGLTSINIPESVEEIEAYAFYKCCSLTSLTIPQNVTSIGDHAFWGCSGLKEITILGPITALLDETFNDCEALENCSIPKTVKSIGAECFFDCAALNYITIPDNVTEIGTQAFAFCGLTDLTLSSNITTLGEYALLSNTQLKSLKLLANIKEVPEGLCVGCSSLSEILFSESIKKVNYQSFAGTAFTDFTPFKDLTFDDSGSQFMQCPFQSVDLSNLKVIPESIFQNCTQLQEVKFSNELTEIGGGAFMNTAIQSVELPNSLEAIRWRAFEDTHLEEIDVPSGVKVIEAYAFSNNPLRTATIPSTVTTVGDCVFDYCENLVGLFWESSAPVMSITKSHNNNCFLYLTSHNGTAPEYDTSWDGRVVVDGVADHIVLEKGENPYCCPKAFTAKKISYALNFSAQSGYRTSAGWQSIVLPFSPTKVTHETAGELAPFGSGKEGTKPFWLRELTATGFVNAPVIEMDHPYIICMPNNPGVYKEEYNISGEVTFSAENVTVAESPFNREMESVEGPEFVMHPSYSMIPKAANVYTLNTTYKLSGYETGSVFARSIQEVYPFEAYVKSTATLRSAIPVASGRSATRGSTADAQSRGITGALRIPQVDDM